MCAFNSSYSYSDEQLEMTIRTRTVAGADLRAMDDQGVSVYKWAVHSQRPRLIEMLEQAGIQD